MLVSFWSHIYIKSCLCLAITLVTWKQIIFLGITSLSGLGDGGGESNLLMSSSPNSYPVLLSSGFRER